MPRARLGSSFWVCLMSAAKAAWGMRGERKKKKTAFALLYFDTASNSRSGSSIFLTPRRFGINIERVSLCCARGAARLRASTKQSICWLTRSVDESDGPRSLGMGCGLSVSWIVNSIQFGLLGGLNCWRVWGKGGSRNQTAGWVWSKFPIRIELCDRRFSMKAPTKIRRLCPPIVVFVSTVAVSLRTVTYLSVVVEVGASVDMFLSWQGISAVCMYFWSWNCGLKHENGD